MIYQLMWKARWAGIQTVVKGDMKFIFRAEDIRFLFGLFYVILVNEKFVDEYNKTFFPLSSLHLFKYISVKNLLIA